ncbi:hypothetical protein SCWH03_47130 [Streptomyces pacificus]|uniref:Uncharacterized protein n=1 Tax=Streptomyces pacificus TaxID=2705029 RepID=A0A6A0B1J1_9ACTN|nr:hypothetical protein SCWH03_47130 [Streptomyces pacificus]
MGEPFVRFTLNPGGPDSKVGCVIDHMVESPALYAPSSKTLWNAGYVRVSGGRNHGKYTGWHP